jgi:Icc-related predicted phosphoesterase
MKPDQIQNIIHLTDIHGAVSHIKDISNEIINADLIIISGDITHFGKKKDAEIIIDSLSQLNSSILAVPGNCDYPEVEEYLSEVGINIHLITKELPGYVITGIGGSIPCPGPTPFEYDDDQAEIWLNSISDNYTGNLPLVFVTHQPPLNTVNDRLPNGRHVGSNSIYNFIRKVQPLICLTGHIHEGIGIDTIGRTQIVNPGPFRAGRYARLNITNKKSVEVTLKQITAKR